MTIVTFAGLIGGSIDKQGGIRLWEGYRGAEYTVAPALSEMLGLAAGLKEERYDNMLPLLRDNFPDAKLVVVGTRASLSVQEALFSAHGTDAMPPEERRILLEDENDFDAVFRTLNSLLENEKELIVDISHGFRHLPILMAVNLIVENISDPEKIRHILFAKEIEKDARYEIVDLRRYLDLSGLAYALASFNDNYTVASNIRLADNNHQALLELLQEVGHHLLANSFETLYTASGEKRPLIERVLSTVDAIAKHPVAATFDRYIARVRTHLGELRDIGALPMDKRLYTLAKMLWQKGYHLNAVTLLDEAIAAYCVEGFARIPRTQKQWRTFNAAIEKESDVKIYNYYELSNISKNIVKLGDKYRKHHYVEGDTAAVSAFVDAAKAYVGEHYRQTKKLRTLLFDCDHLRNNLAHGNIDKAIDDVRGTIGKLFKRYEQICSHEDPLNRHKEDADG